ncbi:VOC family protein [Antarcticirhabdus aurantiaca]|uniref:VOC family protein n=1 Tax=Antarcticirhabdus aurantiaca TaxID=2606717 RepID=A0ACD4NNA0_9HYPH|nr:VOC family protein [Antarcticirhabdus aurantiaca]WAJ28371.1 VOC family protein [Jeongeuplla avenae]
MSHLVHALGHIKLTTTRLREVVRDSTEVLGLRVTREAGGEVWLSSNGRTAELVLIEDDANACHTIGLEALSEADVTFAAGRVEGAGCRILSREPSLGCFRAAVTFATPEGLRFEIHTPAADDMYRPRYATTGVAPRRIDHANLISPDPVATRRQLTEICGMRLSERMVNDALSWMYGGNRQHHILGVVKGTAPGLHHYSFEFPEFAMYCRLGDILDRHDRQLVWGPGRHRPGDNTYAYYLDPSGCMVECSGPMATVADDTAFEPRIITNLERPGNVRDMNVWGTPAPLEWREHFHPFAPVG